MRFLLSTVLCILAFTLNAQQVGSSPIYYSGVDVGINTPTPKYFEVNSRFLDLGKGGNNSGIIVHDKSNTRAFGIVGCSGGCSIQGGQTNALNFTLVSLNANEDYNGYSNTILSLKDNREAIFNGSVGIGGAVGNRKLRVVSTSNGGGQLQFGQLQSTDEAFLRISNQNNWGFLLRSDTNFPKLGAYTGGRLDIYPYAHHEGDLDTTKGALTSFNFSSMKVGIGTSTPSEKLEVKGNIRVSGIEGFSHSNLQFHRATGHKIMTIGQEDLTSANSTFDFHHHNGNDLRFLINDAEHIRIKLDGKVGIGIPNPSAQLDVNGNTIIRGSIESQKVKVTQTPGNWPDYVFAPYYQLPSINELQDYIQRYKHLPGVPSAKEVANEGIDLGHMDATLLKKIEELTLYTIDQEKRIAAQNKLIEHLIKRVEKLEK